MIPVADLKALAQHRLRDARALFSRRRYDGAVDACGYAVEIALKVRICRQIGWKDFPQTNREFEHYKFLKTHSLDVLLTLSGQETRIKTSFQAEWSIVATWDPEARYRTGTAMQASAKAMINATAVLLRRICP